MLFFYHTLLEKNFITIDISANIHFKRARSFVHLLPFLFSLQLGHKLRHVVFIVVLFVVPKIRQVLQDGFHATVARTGAVRRVTVAGRLVREKVEKLFGAHRFQLAVLPADNRVGGLHLEFLQPAKRE